MPMNKLPNEKRAQVLQMMAEGISLRAITRLTGISRTTLQKLLEDAGQAFSEYQDRVLMKLPCRHGQVDEAWAFCYAKQKNVPTVKRAPEGAGDIWTWVGLDADSKLAVCWHVGSRDSEAAKIFINDLAKRLSNRVQLTSDGHKAYLEAVEGAFGAGIDYATLVKVYGEAPEGQRRCRRDLCWNLFRRDLQRDEVTASGGEVNDLIGWLFGEARLNVHLARRDLARSQPGPEQHRGSFRGRQHVLGLDPPLELFMHSLDRIRRVDRFPLDL